MRWLNGSGYVTGNIFVSLSSCFFGLDYDFYYDAYGLSELAYDSDNKNDKLGAQTGSC